MANATAEPIPRAWILSPSGISTTRIFGLSSSERLARALRAAGCENIVECDLTTAPEPPGTGPCVLLRADAVYDERIIEALVNAQDTLLASSTRGENGQPAACLGARVDGCQFEVAWQTLSGVQPPSNSNLTETTARELVPAYTAKLRKSEAPFLFFPLNSNDVPDIERRVFQGSYKGLTDLVTKWVWPAPALLVVRYLAQLHIRPNTVTLVSWVLAVLAFLAFLRGEFAVGLLAAWGMTFLDTVDGKLARCTMTSSRLGDVLDHGLDLIHPPFWWFAWGLGLPVWAPFETTLVVGGYFVGRLLEGWFLAAFRFEIHSWRNLDGLFRTITARRNPNLILLTVATLGGRPDLGFGMVALWTVLSLGFHALALGQALRAKSQGQDIRPWDEIRPETIEPS
ncbi:CDP-alcohol phosphatidyltransferase family protein [Myxococcota bacterium]|nr:CDP-alcohol phosphatidyltransferase family protein [Myxococcota bacterium]